MATCNEFRHSGRRHRGLRPGEGRCRGPTRGAGRRPGWQRGRWRFRRRLRSRAIAGRRVAVGSGGLLAGFRLQAAADGAAIVAVVKRAPAALHIVQQAFLLGPQLLHSLLQPPLLLLVLLQELLLLHPLHVAVAQVHLHQVRHDEANDQHAIAGQRNLAAEGDSPEAVKQHEAYQPKLVPEPQAVGAVHQRARHASYGPFVMLHGFTCHALDVPHHINGHD
eukprot:scaffold94469_cov63-Phaeocystis_antarctica.AAC.1